MVADADKGDLTLSSHASTMNNGKRQIPDWCVHLGRDDHGSQLVALVDLEAPSEGDGDERLVA